MTPVSEELPILMAEDDDGDRLLARKAMERTRIPNPLVTVSTGEELLDYLFTRGKYSSSVAAPKPCLILLDLNMPRMDGREALKVLKSDDLLRKIPVIILSTSRSGEDLMGSYEMGANSYITKPDTFDGLVDILRSLKQYWLETVQLPPVKEFYQHD